MMSKAWMKVVAFSFLAVVITLNTGCIWPRRGAKNGTSGATSVDGDPFDRLGTGGVDMPLDARTPLGMPVTDQEFGSVGFGYDKYRIDAAEQVKIDGVASYMQQNKEVICVTEGHCDERGSREYNFSLGELRALAVRNYLISYGVSPARVQTRSYGEEMPVAMGHAEYDWTQNRRVDFALYRP
jgi:outer membrane protein OmpA-like peptidoglycan-associated protein